MQLDQRNILSNTTKDTMGNTIHDLPRGTTTVPSFNRIDFGEVGSVAYIPGRRNNPGNPNTGSVMGTAPGTNLVRRIGRNMEVPLLLQMIVAPTTGGGALNIAFMEADTETGSGTEICTLTVPSANLAAGTILPVQTILREIKRRYFFLNYTVDTSVGTAWTAGSIFAGFTSAVDGAYRG